jgi:hypothetical protein
MAYMSHGEVRVGKGFFLVPYSMVANLYCKVKFVNLIFLSALISGPLLEKPRVRVTINCNPDTNIPYSGSANTFGNVLYVNAFVKQI